MRNTDIVMLMAGGLLSVWTWAAAEENPQPPPAIKASSGMEAIEKAMKLAMDDPAPPRQKARKQPEPPHNSAPRTPRAPSEPLTPQLDEKNLGLGCSKP